ncbi:hypothetical protein [Kovacikia minuta]|uniref:hypothetical protein n=1 Tax=Kovacikia minuta TaxID=2931930 RepID=UPI0020C813C8
MPYAFVGTAKSEYYLRDEAGWLPRDSWWSDRLERWTGCVYHPWERWLMSRPNCKAVFPRDSLTAKVLRQYGIPAFDLGNPMMDGLEGRDGGWGMGDEKEAESRRQKAEEDAETRGYGDVENSKLTQNSKLKTQNSPSSIPPPSSLRPLDRPSPRFPSTGGLRQLGDNFVGGKWVDRKSGTSVGVAGGDRSHAGDRSAPANAVGISLAAGFRNDLLRGTRRKTSKAGTGPQSLCGVCAAGRCGDRHDRNGH